MKKKEIMIGLGIILILVIIALIYYDLKDPQVCFEGNCFSVEIAKTDAEKARGLMFRENLDEGKGMLFIYDKEGEYNFWMKNTLIPLDIIWINSKKEIVYIKYGAQPCQETCESIIPGINAQYVLEINGGKSVEIGLGIGDKIEFKI